MRRWLTFLVFALGACDAVGAAAVEPIYPGQTWGTKTPDEVGLDAGKLKALSDYAGGFGCVIRHGYLVHTWGDAGRRMDVASAAKPIYVHFLFKAVADGRIFNLDEPVCKWEPRLKGINAKLDYKDARITWRHMANQISCYGLAEEPGTAYAYNDWQMALLFDTLFMKVYGAGLDTVDEAVLHAQLTDMIDCQDDPTFLAFGTGDRPARLGISPRDFARFGLLYLRQGKWRDKQLISPELVRMAVTSPVPNSIPRAGNEAAEMIPGQRSIGSRRIPDNQTDHMGSYSWLWWINGIDRAGKRHWPDVPIDTYGCFGHGGKRAMVVLPGLDLIISWNNTRIEGREKENQALKQLLDAVEPRGLTVDREHPQWLRHADGKPFFMCGPGDPEDFLYRGTLNVDGTRSGDQMQLIEKLEGTGANCLYLQAVRSHGGDGDATHNPFVGHDPAHGVNAKVLDQWEQWFSEMDRHGIVIYLFVYDDSTCVWNTGDEVDAQEREFIETLVNRFEHHDHLIWCIAEEYAERLSAERVRRLAATIKAADDHDHPVAVHLNHGLDFSEFADDPSIDQFAIQYNVPTAEALHAGVVQAWREAKGRYSLNLSEAADWGTDAEARRKAWACAMGGAHVMVLEMDIAGTPAEDLIDCGHLAQFLSVVSLPGMEPHDELAHGDTQYVLAQPGEQYVAYAANATGRLGLRRMKAGEYAFRWFDCATGSITRQESVPVGQGDQVWETPNGFGPEVAVHISRSEN
jgi:CubicO group peptidase (beta-lactamase class C family)